MMMMMMMMVSIIIIIIIIDRRETVSPEPRSPDLQINDYIVV